jgi:hypothetical protein
MLVSKFSQSGPSLAMNARTTCRDATALERPSARATRAGMRRSCGWNRAGARGESQIIWRNIIYEFGGEACNPLKSHKTAKAFFGNPCRKQAEIWKSLEKGLEARLYSAVFAPSRDAAASVSSPGGAPRQEGKFSYPQSLEKSRNGKILPGPQAASPYDRDAPPGSTARGITARRPSRAPAGAARSWRRS